MLKVIPRYLAAQLVLPFFIGFIFLLSFLLTFYMFRMIELVVNKNVDVAMILSLVRDLSLSFIPRAIPIAAFFSTIYSVNKLSEDAEIMALRSFGYSKFKILLPFLAIGISLGFALIELTNELVPKADAQFKFNVLSLSSSGVLNNIKSGQFFSDIPQITLFSDKVNNEKLTFENIFLHVRDSNRTDEQRIIFARFGKIKRKLSKNDNGPLMSMYLEDGNILKTNSKGDELEKIIFMTYDFPLIKNNSSLEFQNRDTMKSNHEIRFNNRQREEEIKNLAKLSQTEEIKKKLNFIKIDIYKSQTELYFRYTASIQIILYVIIGFCLGMSKLRGRTDYQAAKSIGILLGHNGLYFSLISFTNKGALSPVISASVPILFLIIMAAYFYKRIDWLE